MLMTTLLLVFFKPLIVVIWYILLLSAILLIITGGWSSVWRIDCIRHCGALLAAKLVLYRRRHCQCDDHFGWNDGGAASSGCRATLCASHETQTSQCSPNCIDCQHRLQCFFWGVSTSSQPDIRRIALGDQYRPKSIPPMHSSSCSY